MTDIHNEAYWSSQFDITQEDLNRVAERLERAGAPQDLKAVALPIIKGRIEHGHDPSPAALRDLTGRASVRLWDPAGEWHAGDWVLVVHFSSRLVHEIHVGEIRKIENGFAHIKVEELDKDLKYQLVPPQSENATKWRETVRGAVETKLHSGNIDQQTEGILLKHGERIFSRLAETLQQDPRFVSFEGKWYLKEKLPRIAGETLQKIHRTLLEKPSASTEQMLSVVREDVNANAALLPMAIHTAIQQSPQRFENIGTPVRPQWKALLPQPEQAIAAYYAYDPQTYEILCRPGQRLTQKKAQRLQELDLYVHIATFAE